MIFVVFGECCEIGISELLYQFGMLKMMVYCFLQMFKMFGYVVQEGEIDCYWLMIWLFEFGSKVLESVDFVCEVDFEMCCIG